MSIPTDDSATSMSDDAAVEALMQGMEPPKAPKPDPAEDADEDDDSDIDDTADDDDDDTEDADEGDDDVEDADDDQDADDEGDEDDGEAVTVPAEASDDQTITVTVDGVESTVTVASLKRLAGQEASLTRKSQEADLVGGRAAAALNAAIETTLEDLAPYKDVDWLTLQNELDPGEFKWHRDNAARAQARFDKLVGAAGSFEETLSSRRSNATAETAQEAVRELTADVPGWSDKLYGEIINYGISQGLGEEDVKSIANAKVIKLLRKAMLFDAGTKAVAKKVKRTPTKVLKTTRQGSPDSATAASKKSLARLQSGAGSDADAMAVLKGRWA